MTKTYYKTGEYEFMECADCAAQPGSPILCPACYHNRTVVDRLNKLIATTRRETVKGIKNIAITSLGIMQLKKDNTDPLEIFKGFIDYLDQLPDKEEV